MTDVRLTATNPDDSSVVPVACNAKGELKLEEPIDNSFDGHLDGDLTVTGNVGIGTDDPQAMLDVNGTAFIGGNVGIGTDNPQAKLDVMGTAIIGEGGEDSELLRFNHERPWSFFQRGSGTLAGLDLASNGNKNFSISSKKDGDANATANVLINGYNGYVGIGTDDPQTKLDVQGTTAQLTLNSTNDKYSRINHKLSGVSRWTVGTREDADYYIKREGAGATGNIVIPSGNVGIGTDDPKVKLDVAGDVIVNSRNKSWMLVEQSGLCHMVEQTRRSPDVSTADLVDEIQEQEQEQEYPKLRDVFNELDLVEQALQSVMEKLGLTPPAGWPVWDGSDESR